MKNECDSPQRKLPSPLFSKTAREWILSSALYDGIEDEDIRQIEVLLTERGANPNVLLPEYGIAPFHMVVANESPKFAVQATDICLQHGADPNVRSEDGLTPVHLAAMWGSKEVLQVLLAAGGDPWLVDCFNKNAFEYAREENQTQCYNILQSYCNSQPRPSGRSQSPYKLNLKRVVLYKNDLQIVYEANSPSSSKCAATQTSPPANKSLPENNLTKMSNGNCCPTESPKKNGTFSDSSDHKKGSVKEKVKNYELSTRKNDRICSKLRDVILNHRRNSTVFEYSPEKTEQSYSSGIVSWKDVDTNPELYSSIASEIIDNLQIANKLRKSIQTNTIESELLKNVTKRKKSPDIQTDHSERKNSSYFTSSDQSNKCISPILPPNIGFVLDNSLDNSTILSRRRKHNKSTGVESPPSIGFMLDNLDDTSPETRGSSLFSDFDSYSEASVQKSSSEEQKSLGENLVTEDESLPKERPFSKCSTSDSLSPYVSCVEGNTRGLESSDCFESCLEKDSETRANSCEADSSKVVSNVLEDLLSNMEENKRTPVNPKVTTSTPERICEESIELTFGTAASGPCKDSTNKRQWVEAQVQSSSDEEQFMSIAEEYQYTDMDEGVVLIEKRYLLNDLNVAGGDKRSGSRLASSTSEESEVSTISGSEGAYDTDEMRRELQQHGFVPGPINGSTKRVYLRKLKRFRRRPDPPPQPGQPAYSPELLKTLNASCEHLFYEWAHLEDSMTASFSVNRRQWREGHAKTSFTYLLLDPRLAYNLPVRARTEPHSQLWPEFLQAVFYVGKGKRDRPYSHLYEASKIWKYNEPFHSKKIERILDIWKCGEGVICLHVFLNVIPVEAFTREAAMISALTLAVLTNMKGGEMYGSAACWSPRLKRRLGCVLLHRAYKVFLAEGERQLRPDDID